MAEKKPELKAQSFSDFLKNKGSGNVNNPLSGGSEGSSQFKPSFKNPSLSTSPSFNEAVSKSPTDSKEFSRSIKSKSDYKSDTNDNSVAEMSAKEGYSTSSFNPSDAGRGGIGSSSADFVRGVTKEGGSTDFNVALLGDQSKVKKGGFQTVSSEASRKIFGDKSGPINFNTSKLMNADGSNTDLADNIDSSSRQYGGPSASDEDTRRKSIRNSGSGLKAAKFDAKGIEQLNTSVTALGGSKDDMRGNVMGSSGGNNAALGPYVTGNNPGSNVNTRQHGTSVIGSTNAFKRAGLSMGKVATAETKRTGNQFQQVRDLDSGQITSYGVDKEITSGNASGDIQQWMPPSVGDDSGLDYAKNKYAVKGPKSVKEFINSNKKKKLINLTSNK
tara:strand:+ start:65 stop:1225 length:1161 start_codon:yes stop_codon:yes gene_type:complete